MSLNYKDYLPAQASALVNFIKVFSSESALRDIGPNLTCEECDALYDLLMEHGQRDAADTLLRAHVRCDTDGDSVEHLEMKKVFGPE